MAINHRQALQMLWTDSCSVFVRQEVTDEETKLTDFQEAALLEDQPCKLSFETLSVATGDEAATAAQTVKLFLSSDRTVPAGSKIVVTRGERTFVFSCSGEPGVFFHHQEIPLEKFRGWA